MLCGNGDEAVNFHQRHAHNLAAGCHPLGMPLGPEGRMCGECANRKPGFHYDLCAKHPGRGGASGGVRLRWPACLWFTEPEKCEGG